jgi:hypothetical protein
MAQSSCCPSGSWGELKNPDYVPKGIVEKSGDIDIYRVNGFFIFSLIEQKVNLVGWFHEQK